MSDTGDPDPRLARALAAGDLAQTLAAFVDARVFAAITATATGTHTGAHGLRQESSAEMAVVLLEAPDGSRALPVFTDLEQLKCWRLDVRPVALTGPQACQTALDEGADAVIVNPAGADVTVTELVTLAQGFVPVLGTDLSARRAETVLRTPASLPEGLAQALSKALRRENLRSARLLESEDGLVLGISAHDELTPAGLAALAQRLLAAVTLPPGGLDLAQVAPRGQGIEVLRGRLSLLRSRVRPGSFTGVEQAEAPPPT